jgi:hypothetical protein
MKKVLITLLAVLGISTLAYAQEHPGDHAMDAHASDSHKMSMQGMLGKYSASREASGTSWQPDASPHEGIHFSYEEWNAMVHGFATVIYNNQGGERGDQEIFGTNMLMAMAQRPLGQGTLGVRTMLSLEPWTVGQDGYALLLQTGETADGRTELIDRQHPHDFFMELAGTYSVPVTSESSVFVYAGLPGEPALGPPTFMHRFSGIEIPEAPITHHWLDSTHITFGVLTLGYIWNNFKIESSTFRGREPDEDRWDIEAPGIDSYSARLSVNPTEKLALQVSYGMIDSPEQLHPQVDTDRATVSASYHERWGETHWQTTLAWGRNMNDPGRNLDAGLLESTMTFAKTHTVFGRAETVEKDELFDDDAPRHGQIFHVNKVSLGYIYDFPEWNEMRWGVGGLGGVHFLPSSLDDTYDDTPVSFMVFVRAKI